MSRTNNVFKPTSGCIVRHYKADSVFCGTSGCQTEGYVTPFDKLQRKYESLQVLLLHHQLPRNMWVGMWAVRLLSIPKSNSMCHKGRLGLYDSKHWENRFEWKTDDNSIGEVVFYYRVLKNHYNSYNITVVNRYCVSFLSLLIICCISG